MSDTISFGQRLSALMDERDLTQAALAKEVDVSRSSISRFCRDKAEPDADQVADLAQALDIDVETLLEGTDFTPEGADGGDADDAPDAANDDEEADASGEDDAPDEAEASEEDDDEGWPDAVDAIQDQLAARDATIAALRNELADKESELQELNATLAELDEERAAALEAQANAESRAHELETLLRSEKKGAWIKSSAIGVAGAGLGALLGYFGRDN